VQSLANARLGKNVAAIRAGGTPRDDEALTAALAAVLGVRESDRVYQGFSAAFDMSFFGSTASMKTIRV